MSLELLTLLGRQAGDHLWQSTLFALAIAILAHALRDNQARVRYWLWLAASLKFLLPFSLLTALGFHLTSRFPASIPAPRILFVLDDLAAPLMPTPGVAVPSHINAFPVLSILALWSLGCAALLLHAWRRWWRVRTVIRAASTVRDARLAAKAPGIRIVSSQVTLEPGVFGIFRPTLYLPAAIANSLSDPELDAVLRHEICHARRRDNLTAALQIVAEAFCWFHPLVWWLGARLVEERERACDEAVLRSGADPQVYAQAILQVCTQCLKSPSACVAGVTGSSLKQRIEEIMSNRVITQLSSGRKVLLAGAALLAVIVPVMTGLLDGPRLSAQPSETIVAAPSGPKFEVASIKPAPIPTAGPLSNSGIQIDAARVDIRFWSLQQLILRAYGLPRYQLSAPDGIANPRFDIVAKLPEGIGRDQLPEMLQWLLADRFGFTAHTETRDLPGFALVIGKGGLKIKPSEPDPDAAAEPASQSRLERAGQLFDRLASNDARSLGIEHMTVMRGVMRADFKRMPMEALAQVLADRLQAPVLNQTGLSGDYRMTLELPVAGSAPISGPPGVELPAALEPVSVSLFSTVERLGLKLEPRKTALPMLVVDTVNRSPSDN